MALNGYWWENLHRKPCLLPSNIEVSCKCSLKMKSPKWMCLNSEHVVSLYLQMAILLYRIDNDDKPVLHPNAPKRAKRTPNMRIQCAPLSPETHKFQKPRSRSDAAHVKPTKPLVFVVRKYIIAWPSRPAQPSTYLGKYKDLPPIWVSQELTYSSCVLIVFRTTIAINYGFR